MVRPLLFSQGLDAIWFFAVMLFVCTACSKQRNVVVLVAENCCCNRFYFADPGLQQKESMMSIEVDPVQHTNRSTHHDDEAHSNYKRSDPMETLDRVNIDKVVNKSYISYIFVKAVLSCAYVFIIMKFVSFMNLSAFSKIMKKYEKNASRGVSSAYMKVVDNSYLGISDELQEKRDGFVLQSKRKKLIQLKIMNFSQHLSSSPSFLISHPSLFSPLIDSSSPLPIITAGHCRRCCRCRRRHYLQPESNHHPTPPIHSTVNRQQAFSPSRSSSPSYVLQQTSNLEKIDGFVKPGGWNEFYIARGRTCSETVSKQGEANDGNCNNGYCSGCSSSIVRHASELNADIALLYLEKKKTKKWKMRLKKPKVESTKEKQEEEENGVVQGKRESSQVSNDKIEETAS
ncbi:EXS (ERD1/XPR1/SYG1) family protein [Trifolium repens]|nr:EXS (ERD1/XPR1/SYG1) family protein [Trifolium repens]